MLRLLQVASSLLLTVLVMVSIVSCSGDGNPASPNDITAQTSKETFLGVWTIVPAVLRQLSTQWVDNCGTDRNDDGIGKYQPR